LVLLDGVNELPGELRGEVESFRREFQRTTPMIFTTRELNVGLDLGIEKKLEMQPLSEKQMKEFTCSYLGQEQGQKLINGLGEKLQKFGETPLLLWMLCGVYKTVGEIPANLGGVFRGFARIYNQNRFDDRQSSEYLRFLQRLAVAMMPQDEPLGLRLSIPRAEVEEIFREFMQAERESNVLSGAIGTLDELLRFHLLRPKDKEEIEFSHQLFQEYYAGEHLLGQLPKLTDLELQKCYLNYVDWTEAVALMAGLVGDGKQAVRLVELGLKVDLMLGARLAGAVKTEFKEKAISLLIDRSLPQLILICLLGLSRSEAAIPYLKDKLDTNDSNTCRYVIQAFGKIPTQGVVKILYEFVNNTDNIILHGQVAEALGEIGNISAAVLEDWDRQLEELNITEKLEQVGYLKIRIEMALWNIHGDERKPILFQQMSCNYNEQDFESEFGEISLDNLIKAMEEKYSYYSNFEGFVERNLASYLDKEVIPMLGKIASEGRSNSKCLAIKLLSKRNCPEILPILIKALKDTDPLIRRSAIYELAKTADKSLISELFLVIFDSDKTVRKAAIKALGKIGGNESLKILTILFQDHRSVYDIEDIIEAIGDIGHEESIDLLVSKFDKENYSLSKNIVKALGNIGGDKATEILIQFLHDKEFNREHPTFPKTLVKNSKTLILPLSKMVYLQKWDASKFNIRENVVEALEKIAQFDRNLPALTQRLPYLFSLIFTEISEQALSVITAIQTRCKLYNYEISQTPLPAITPTLSSVTNNIAQVGQIIQNQNVAGNNTGIQNL